MKGRISVIIAEDQAMVLGALAALLELDDEIEVVGVAGDGRTALELLKGRQPDVVLTDIEMPGMSGIELARRVRDILPTARTIVLTTFARSGYLQRALAAGVKGYLLKDAPADQLAAAIRKIHAGGRVIAAELLLDAWAEQDPLSERERQVLKLAGEGRTTAEIARSVALSDGTVRNYLSEAISKLGASNRVEAARIALRKGWL